MKKFILYLMATILLIACKKNQQDKIFPVKAEIFIRKTAADDSVKVNAQVFYADSIADGHVDTTTYRIHLNEEMPLLSAVNMNGDKYYLLKAKLATNNLKLEIKRNKREVMSVSQILKPVSIELRKSTHARNQDMIINWKGEPLTDNEQIFCMLVSGQKSTGTSQKSGTGNQIILSQGQLSELAAGDAMLQLIRTATDSVAKDNNYSKLRLEYYSVPTRITLE